MTAGGRVLGDQGTEPGGGGVGPESPMAFPITSVRELAAMPAISVLAVGGG